MVLLKMEILRDHIEFVRTILRDHIEVVWAILRDYMEVIEAALRDHSGDIGFITALVVLIIALKIDDRKRHPEKYSYRVKILKKIEKRILNLEAEKSLTDDERKELNNLRDQESRLTFQIDNHKDLKRLIYSFSDINELDRQIKRKKLKSFLYFLFSIIFFIVTGILSFIAPLVFASTFFDIRLAESVWSKIVELTHNGITTEFILIMLALPYSLVLALLFMRFHNNVERDLSPLLSERLKWKLISKTLIAADLANKDPSKDLVLDTFTKLRNAVLDQLNAHQTPDDRKSDDAVIKTPVDIITHLLIKLTKLASDTHKPSS